MPIILDGGRPTTKSYSAISTTPVMVAPERNGNASYRSLLTVQNFGAVPVYLGGSDVAASGPSRGIVLVGVADPTTTQPVSMTLATTGHAYYAVVASGTGDISVLEEVYP